MIRGIVVVTICLAALAVPGSALAQGGSNSPTEAQYAPASQQVTAGGGPGGGASSTSAAPSREPVGGLPFTGADLGVLALAAATLLGAGFLLRRMARPERRGSTGS